MYSEAQIKNLINLEKKHRARLFVEGYFSPETLSLKERSLAPLKSSIYYIESFNDQFFDKLFICLSKDNLEDCLSDFRKIIPATYSEELFSFLNDSELKDLYSKLHIYLDSVYKEIITIINERLSEGGHIAINDKIQFSQKITKRSLTNLKDNFVEISIDNIDSLIRKADSDIRPVSEINKNSRLFTVNGFKESKLSLIVHDLVDHFWFFEILDSSGIFNKYEALFKSIGDPQKYDIFKREGELVATIAFGVRLFNVIEQGFKPIYSYEDLYNHIVNHFKVNYVHKNNIPDALRILLSMDPNSRNAQSLSFVFSNLVTELDEQKRKHGYVWSNSADGKKLEFSPMGEMYMSFVVEAHNELLLSRNKHRNFLFGIQLIIEDWLIGISNGRKENLKISLGSMKSFDYDSVNIPPETILWIQENYGYLATRNKIY